MVYIPKPMIIIASPDAASTGTGQLSCPVWGSFGSFGVGVGVGVTVGAGVGVEGFRGISKTGVELGAGVGVGAGVEVEPI